MERKTQMRTYSRRDMLKQAFLAASATVGASLARMPLLHAAEPAKWAFAWHWAHVPGT